MWPFRRKASREVPVPMRHYIVKRLDETVIEFEAKDVRPEEGGGTVYLNFIAPKLPGLTENPIVGIVPISQVKSVTSYAISEGALAPIPHQDHRPTEPPVWKTIDGKDFEVTGD